MFDAHGQTSARSCTETQDRQLSGSDKSEAILLRAETAQCLSRRRALWDERVAARTNNNANFSVLQCPKFGGALCHHRARAWLPDRDGGGVDLRADARSEEHTSELQSRGHLVCRL